ncbi:MAG: efflux RND transporter periplasmic adaptor subunit [Sphingomonadales bacterium]|nr:efflux RND transporter periplasmic adaptor subunit [Sphingomonadales bacterium]
MVREQVEKVLSQFKGQSPIAKLAISVGLAVVLLVGFNVLVGKASDEKNTEVARVFPVQVETVKYLDSHLIRHKFTGHIVAGRRSSLGFELGGRIEHVFKDNGDQVSAGEAIATLDMSRTKARLRSLRAQEQELVARLHLAERSRARREETFNDSHTSQQVLDEAIANEMTAKAQLERIKADIDMVEVDLNASTIKSPFAGVVDRRLLDEGVIVTAGTPIVTILENDNYEAQVGVPSEYVNHLRLGSLVDLESEAGAALKAEVLRVSPAIRGDTRTQLVTLKLQDLSLISFGELVTLRLDSQRNSRGFWVPITALTADVRGLWRLYRLNYNDQNKDAPPTIVVENVQVLHVDNDKVFVSGSINDGAQIVSVGVSKLTPNQHVEPVLSEHLVGTAGE